MAFFGKYSNIKINVVYNSKYRVSGGGGCNLKLWHSTHILCALMSYIEWISIEFHEAKPA